MDHLHLGLPVIGLLVGWFGWKFYKNQNVGFVIVDIPREIMILHWQNLFGRKACTVSLLSVGCPLWYLESMKLFDGNFSVITL